MTRSSGLSATPSITQEEVHTPIAFGSFHAYQTQTIKNLPFWQPCLIMVQTGVKRLQCRQQETQVQAGEMVLIPAGIRCQLENQPDATAGEYRALAFELSQKDVESLARQLNLTPAPVMSTGGFCTLKPNPQQQQVMRAIISSVTEAQLHPAIIRHRLQELLLHWIIQNAQIWPLLQPRSASITCQVQALVAEAPDRNWTLALLAAKLHRSVATLSRQLKEEQSGLRAILDDVRLVQAFNLLQTTHASLDQVAEQCGYQSLARFSERFRAYFGLTPAQLRRTREPVS
ncbi:MAG: helix-turn-helix transcriptional regulator [Hahellaceae bacterium]|nr:helix-turn-helix transcriptional regulator [Hahellaceae bacterium]